jgi:hypothetical protein
MKNDGETVKSDGEEVLQEGDQVLEGGLLDGENYEGEG